MQTLYPVLRRPTLSLEYTRERLTLPDGDFLDLDWSLAPGSQGQRAGGVALVIHGLEGHSRRKYLQGMVKALNGAGWDCVAMNHRGCSGEMNRLARFYHSGETDDVHSALTYAIGAGQYNRAALVGFSMGGNQTLKYLGEDPQRVPVQLQCAVAVSAPCDLAGCARVLEQGFSRVYQAYLMRSLRQKVREKHEIFPDRIPVDGLSRMTTFREFDDAYTAPCNGFRDAADYYEKCSSARVLEGIQIPVLTLSAQDDPFLSEGCYPYDMARGSQWLHLETPQTGGHVGFAVNGAAGPYYSEQRAVEFLDRFA
ncbi:YheT family hydrolase [Desulfovibrio ferrophilus]|uniref:AB hydrolase-1 domain-containing protein n=1 Tax=Desulfovibrio ferrophilus TaxID=241368 RepID=A0A2Z6B0Z2_9BACT|nr:alpha/beta fold hydrolase [Desulfovibrio ferrophilus]BBD09144.1 uncharacterized protein DFE_2418 [Desulfovibrio ferrophilus]